MLLAICIFMVLAVIGFNVLAAASANTYNSRVQLANEQAIQYVNSIYEIVDGMIQGGEFNLDACLEEEGTEVSGMTAVLGTNNLEGWKGEVRAHQQSGNRLAQRHSKKSYQSTDNYKL